MEEEWEEVGRVFTYFSKAGVAGIKLSKELKIGDEIWIKGHTTDFKQRVESMQINRQSVEVAPANSEVGIKVNEKVRNNDRVYRKKA